jgi:hypothetical protein
MVRQHAPLDPLGLLRHEARARLVSHLTSFRRDALAEGAQADDLPDLFYYRNRLPNWLGGIRGVRAHERQPVMPLGAPALQRLAFQLTADERAAEYIHYRLVRDCAPDLLAIPFAHQRWSRALADAPVVEPLLAKGHETLFGNWQWAIDREPLLRRWLSDFFVASDVPLWADVDRGRLLALLRDHRFSYLELIALLGLTVAVFHQTGTVLPRRIGADRETLQVRRLVRPAPPVAWFAPTVSGNVDSFGGAAGLDEEGRVLLADAGEARIAGWAVAPEWPGAAPLIELRADGRCIGTARPLRDRPDLAVLGLPHTRYGFLIAFDAAEALGAVELSIKSAETVFARYFVATRAGR